MHAAQQTFARSFERGQTEAVRIVHLLHDDLKYGPQVNTYGGLGNTLPEEFLESHMHFEAMDRYYLPEVFLPPISISTGGSFMTARKFSSSKT